MPSRVEMPSISFMVARSSPGHVIGCENKLPWHLGTDLARFKKNTLGHVILMGRRTHDSIGRVLPGRTTIVLSRNPDPGRENTLWNVQETSLFWAGDRENALFLADFLSIGRGKKDFFVVGGEEIFRMFSDLFYKVYLTEVLGDIVGDAKFDFEFKYPFWKQIFAEDHPRSDVDDYPSRYSVFVKRDKKTRFRIFPDFLTDANSRREWVKQNLPKITAQKTAESAQSSNLLLFPEEQA
jgi:dihydrofolate reductase